VNASQRIVAAVGGLAVMVTAACGGGDAGPAHAGGPPTGAREVASIPIGPEPAQLAAGFGSVWAVSLGRHLARIDPRTNTVLARIEAANGGFVGVGAGAVWVPDYVNDALRRIDPSTNKVAARIAVGDSPEGVGVSPGAVWVANHHGGSVSRIDPRTNAVVATIRVGPQGQSGPQALAVGAGSVWVGVPNLASVVRIDAATNRVTARIALPSQVPPCGGIAVDQRAVWVSAGGCNVGVARIDPATNGVTQVLFAKDGQPIEYGAEAGQPVLARGSFWVTQSGPAFALLYEIDPRTGETVSKTKLRPGSGDSVFAFGSLWFGDGERRRVIRLAPRSQRGAQ
jgi:YVTN family beta-propeller protein